MAVVMMRVETGQTGALAKVGALPRRVPTGSCDQKQRHGQDLKNSHRIAPNRSGCHAERETPPPERAVRPALLHSIDGAPFVQKTFKSRIGAFGVAAAKSLCFVSR